MTDAAIIELYFSRSEQAIAESETSYGGYCYHVANGILNDRADSEESVNDTWLATWERHSADAPAESQGIFRRADPPHLR